MSNMRKRLSIISASVLLALIIIFVLTIQRIHPKGEQYKRCKACFRYIAEIRDIPTDEETLFKLAAESSLKWHKLVAHTEQVVFVIKPDFVVSGQSWFRGTHDTGRYYLFLSQDQEVEFIYEFDGQDYRWVSLDGKTRIYVSLPSSTDKLIEVIYEWNGTTFTQTSYALYQDTSEGSKVKLHDHDEMSKHTLILEYSDFGPQAAAYQLIGFEWWQWNTHGDSDPTTTCDIKVVVYKDIPLKEVQAFYPINQDLQRDYRYLEYEKALVYLDERIDENFMDEVTLRLKQTRKRLVGHFRQE